jgi:hypothetical protein
MKNYMQTETYMEHCIEEFYDILEQERESKLQDFLDVEFNKSTELDILLTFDALIVLCRDKYKDFFEKTKKEYVHSLCTTLSDENCAEIFNAYREYETVEYTKYEDGTDVTYCNYCGKPLLRDSDIRFIEGDGSYCYEQIKEVKDISITCIGKELLNCGYSEKDIMFMIGPDYNEYSEAISSEEGFDSYNFLCENGYAMPEIFCTTAE